MGKKKNPHGHYCKVCGQRKSNESFSGKGHAAHICKVCARMPAAEQSEEMTLRRLQALPFHRRLTDAELKWLKNRTKDDRDAVREMAKEVYAARFPFAERNEMKKQLHIWELTFVVDATVWDEYGDEVSVAAKFYLEKSEPVIVMQALGAPDESDSLHLESGLYAKLMKRIVRYYEIFCWEQDYCISTSTDEESDDPDYDLDLFLQSEGTTEDSDCEESNPTWSVSVKYTNGTEQEIHGTHEYLPDKVEELYWELAWFFEPDEDDEDFPIE